MIKKTTFAWLDVDVYTVIMSKLPQVSSPTRPKTVNVKSIATLYAAILIIFAVTQLFSFPAFQTLLESFWLPGGRPAAYLLSSIIVVAEIFALPFLLQMRVSTLMRFVSVALGWLVPIVWLGLGLWVQLTVNAITNIGFLGTVVSLAPGWWTIFFSLALATLSIWASWGMWPDTKTSKS